MACEGVLNPSPSRETYYGWTESLLPNEIKWTTYRRRQKDQLGSNNVGGDHIGRMAH